MTVSELLRISYFAAPVTASQLSVATLSPGVPLKFAGAGSGPLGVTSTGSDALPGLSAASTARTLYDAGTPLVPSTSVVVVSVTVLMTASELSRISYCLAPVTASQLSVATLSPGVPLKFAGAGSGPLGVTSTGSDALPGLSAASTARTLYDAGTPLVPSTSVVVVSVTVLMTASELSRISYCLAPVTASQLSVATLSPGVPLKFAGAGSGPLGVTSTGSDALPGLSAASTARTLYDPETPLVPSTSVVVVSVTVLRTASELSRISYFAAPATADHLSVATLLPGVPVTSFGAGKGPSGVTSTGSDALPGLSAASTARTL